MSNTVVVSGSNYTVPDPHEKTWGQNVTDLLIALAAAVPSNSSTFIYVSVTSTPITVISGRTYLVDTSVARTLNLPAPAANAFFFVKDISGTAETNNITIHPTAGVSIDGSTSDKVIAMNNVFMLFISDGTSWYILLQI